MQDEWDLGVKAVCLACNPTVDTSTGQTPFFAMFGQEATLGIGYFPYLKLTGKWGYQTGLKWCKKDSREIQQATVRQNSQYYKPIMSRLEVGEWVSIILGWTVKDCREIFPALAEVMEVYERGKPRTVSIDVLKEFRVKLNCFRIDTCLRNRYGVGHLLHL